MNTPNETLIWLLAGLYLITNALCMAAYVPQIVKVWKHRRAREEVVLITWWVWAFGGLTEWAYAAAIAHSITWQVVAVCHTLACLLVAVLATLERVRRLQASRRLDNEGASRPVALA